MPQFLSDENVNGKGMLDFDQLEITPNQAGSTSDVTAWKTLDPALPLNRDF